MSLDTIRVFAISKLPWIRQQQQKKLLDQARESAREYLHRGPRTSGAARREILARWYRELVKVEVPDLIAKWTPFLGTNVNQVFVQQMKTKWGS
ncbi:MAG TPA: YgjP-like metallopeptidase domain-containing protein [Burkholderiales bacterium]|nr:YgjP-like metallopeptidase domain-containing protein [Burkholderiales bacterium]